MKNWRQFVNFLMHQSFETPAPAPFGLERGVHLGTKVSGAFPRPYFSTHGTPFVKQIIIAERNTLVKKYCWQSWKKNRLIFERPANNPVGHAKTVTSSEFPAYRGTKMKCIRGESTRNPPLRPECMITRDKSFNAANATTIPVRPSYNIRELKDGAY